MKLVVEGLNCIRGGRGLFQGLSFGLSRGEAIVVTGPNGAGKTSLLRLIAGFLTPAGGRIVLEDAQDTVAESSHFVGHLDAVKGALTAGENLAFGRDLLGGGHANIESALDRLGIGALKDLPAQVFSAGQRRRLALARLLVAPRPIWLLDEPTAALDSAGQQTLAHLMSEHCAGGGMIIAATHAVLDLKGAREISLPSGGVS
jgi:heme exporter protein A